MRTIQSERPPDRFYTSRTEDRYTRMMEQEPISGVWLIEELAETEITRVRDENQSYMKAKLCRRARAR